MTIEIINFKNNIYPKFQADGYAAQFIIPFALKVCKGIGYDIGCMKKEWAFPGAMPIDKIFNDGWDATHLPESKVDYIFSSHALEHIEDWVRVLDYWTSLLKIGGVLFLYLPHPEQQYWRPWADTKHLHILYPQDIINYLKYNGYINIFNGDRDLNHSFSVMGEKREYGTSNK
jgi:SAM-dependent methyltransferase